MGTVSGDKVDTVGAAVSVTTGVSVPPTDMFDGSNPKSVVSLVPERWRWGFEQARLDRPDLFALDERELYKQLKSEGKAPNAVLNTVRLKFWIDYERCQAGDGRRIEIFKVLGEVMRNVNFERFLLSKPEKAAWILCPPTEYRMKLEEALCFGMDKLRDILDLDVIQTQKLKNGKVKQTVNVKLGELQAKIVNMLDVRLHGAARQVIEQTSRNLNVSVNATSAQVSGAVEDLTASELDKQIKQLEMRERRALNLPADIPAEFNHEGGSDVADGVARGHPNVGVDSLAGDSLVPDIDGQ